MRKEDSRSRLAFRLGRAIQTARKVKGLSQAEVAERLELSVNFIARVERGEAFMSVPKLIEVSRLLGVSLDAVVDEARAGWTTEMLALAGTLREGERAFLMRQLRAAAGTSPPKPR
jgi:transcriptional regulator with XRE-family HTH domain